MIWSRNKFSYFLAVKLSSMKNEPIISWLQIPAQTFNFCRYWMQRSFIQCEFLSFQYLQLWRLTAPFISNVISSEKNKEFKNWPHKFGASLLYKSEFFIKTIFHKFLSNNNFIRISGFFFMLTILWYHGLALLLTQINKNFLWNYCRKSKLLSSFVADFGFPLRDLELFLLWKNMLLFFEWWIRNRIRICNMNRSATSW